MSEFRPGQYVTNTKFVDQPRMQSSGYAYPPPVGYSHNQMSGPVGGGGMGFGVAKDKLLRRRVRFRSLIGWDRDEALIDFLVGK